MLREAAFSTKHGTVVARCRLRWALWRSMDVFPQNFDLLAGGEDQIRQMSKVAIEASENLSLHARMIERRWPSPVDCKMRWRAEGGGKVSLRR
jgi:hypothetical protein